ncbi:hypothetical protein [Antarctobacter jejuensis]|uniref:hypothetical protein n=1 Tax=Antarctobacter jejuensis TaxID=1439938 RepID=UPI003FD15349
MDIILHAGAHRSASTSFQFYLRENRDALQVQRIGFWGPWRTRKGLLHSVAERPETVEAARRAAGRVALNVEGARRRGHDALIVSDENMIGSLRSTVRRHRLYPAVGERMARLNDAFGGATRVFLQIRSLDHWWSSAIGYLVPRGEGMPSPDALEAMSKSPRSWRHVVTDLACACPGAQIHVTAFENLANRPDLLLQVMTGRHVVPAALPGAFWRNRRPDVSGLRDVLEARGEASTALTALPGDARWMPFNEVQAARLRETYADDLYWLTAGADGLATLTEDPEPARQRLNLAAAAMKRGLNDDRPARELAQGR